MPLGALSEECQTFVKEQVAREELEKEAAAGIKPDRFTESIRNEPTNPSHYIARGRMRLSREDYEGAIKDFTKAIELNPQDPDAYNGRGKAYHRNNDLIAAQRDFNQAIQVDSQYAPAYKNRGENLYKLALDKKQSVPELDAQIEQWQRFWNHARKGNLKRAPWQPLNATKGDVSRPAVLRQMAKMDLELYERLRDYDDHDWGYGHRGYGGYGHGGYGHGDGGGGDGPGYDGVGPAPGLGVYPPECLKGETITLVANASQLMNGMPAEAKPGEKPGPNAPKIPVDSVDFYRDVDGDGLFGAEADQYLASDSEASDGLAGGYDYAVRDYDNLLRQKDEPDADLYYNRGCGHLAAGRLESALSDFSKSITLNETHSLAYNNRGATYARMGDLAKAIEDFTKAIEIEPANRLAYRNRALAYKKLGELRKAQADFEIVLKLQKESEGT